MNQRGVLLETPGSWSEPLHWPLRDGEQKLLTLGSNADWSIADGALLPVHATLYFDGSSLCVAAAPGALLNGEPIGKDWSPVALPAQLSLGETKITLAPSDRESPPEPVPAAAAQPAPEPTSPPEPASPPEPEHVEAERVTPSEAFLSPFIDPDATVLAMPALMPPTPYVPAPLAAPLAPPEPAPSPSPRSSTPEPPRGSGFVHSFQSASWPKRLTVLLLPVVIGLYALKAVRQHSAAHLSPASTAPSAGASASATPSAAPANPEKDAPTSAPTVAAPVGDPHAVGITLQRRAVDAFASGNYREAAQLYQRLAAENPGQAAFAVAARLAGERATGVGHD